MNGKPLGLLSRGGFGSRGFSSRGSFSSSSFAFSRGSFSSHGIAFGRSSFSSHGVFGDSGFVSGGVSSFFSGRRASNNAEGEDGGERKGLLHVISPVRPKTRPVMSESAFVVIFLQRSRFRITAGMWHA